MKIGTMVAHKNDDEKLMGRIDHMHGDSVVVDFDDGYDGAKKFFYHVSDLIYWHGFSNGDPVALRDSPHEYIGRVIRSNGMDVFIKKPGQTTTGSLVAAPLEFKYNASDLIRYRLKK